MTVSRPSKKEKRLRILVVDDVPDTREVLSRNLFLEGYEVTAASSAGEAREILETKDVDLVVTDLKMPGADGMSLARHVKARRPGVAVVIITGYPAGEAEMAVLAQGVDGFLTKPFTDVELLSVVRNALQGDGGRRCEP